MIEKSSRRQRLFLQLLVCLLLWWVLTGGDHRSWLIGGLSISLALLVMTSIPPAPGYRLSLTGVLRFVPYFLWQSVCGGMDVARRAFSPRLPLDPALISYPLSLPAGSARIFFLNCISLLPGTLSADLDADRLRIHVLDQHHDPQLQRLERHVAALFGLDCGDQP